MLRNDFQGFSIYFFASFFLRFEPDIPIAGMHLYHTALMSTRTMGKSGTV